MNVSFFLYRVSMAILAAGVKAASMAMENIHVLQELEVCCRRVEGYARSHGGDSGAAFFAHEPRARETGDCERWASCVDVCERA